ncbi:MAG: hypothetical protein ACPLSJ_01565 [Thermosulfidibacteraceae bacterium]
MEAKKRGGGIKFEEITIKLDSKIYRLLNAVCGGDLNKVNKVIRALLAESLRERSTEELLNLANQPIRKRKRGKEEEEGPDTE